ncbi:LLM class flavin-dependent oxidoreductase [Actinocorallia sp. API 0066]|uniref:LLM class flavin-dependent oxidoreductase n=1 Tax=Actinocorallia sp. API 0066 TaxID=2896846 RepID=UPI001E3894E0|nr:LLM class flavin-dependent oxidoreductase [Actinocorallia sp. API 0066]MCD0451736.1 LLM class flavin-dependent oxidoreductase [Actinocorallia sp. API 0066]
MSKSTGIPLSVLDLAHVVNGSTSAQALRDSADLARKAESLGYVRFWVAEHHGAPGVASASPAVLAAHLAGLTTNLRVGSGGVMLPNHPPLVAAEQFGTLEALHPGRIDLGIGRAPGGDPVTARALRRPAPGSEDYEGQLTELIGYFDTPEERGRAPRIAATPATGNRPDVWLLGSSSASAALAGRLGLPFAYAYHYNPAGTNVALAAYRQSFQPSAHRDRPYALIAALVIVADSDEEAARLAAPNGLNFLRYQVGDTREFPSTEEAAAHPYTPAQRAAIKALLAPQLIGSPGTVRSRTAEVLAQSGADELMALTMLSEAEASLRSHELLAEALSTVSPVAVS